MAIDQPTATIIAAGMTAVGVVSAAWINKNKSNAPTTEKPIQTKVVGKKRQRVDWISLVAFLFSVFMFFKAFGGIMDFMIKPVPVTSLVLVEIGIYGMAVFIFTITSTWNANVVFRSLRK